MTKLSLSLSLSLSLERKRLGGVLVADFRGTKIESNGLCASFEGGPK